MSDALSFVEIDGQHAELLPARTVLSMFSAGGSCGCGTSTSTSTSPSTGTGTGGGQGSGMAEFFDNVFFTNGNVYNYVTGGAGSVGSGGTPTSGTGGGH
jgi:hypothetical protein